jgi:hypothetical protein
MADENKTQENCKENKFVVGLKEVKDDTIKMLNARFVGFMVAWALLVWGATIILEQLGIGSASKDAGDFARIAFYTYTGKKILDKFLANGNGSK